MKQSGEPTTASPSSRDFSAALLAWYDAGHRALPWRAEPGKPAPDPYRTWISEIMLQQTRVEAVRPYYERFLRELPDIRALADCPEERLLKFWEGLGYYSRARNLQKAAILICKEHGGEMPRTRSLLRELPGIGDYTSAAIASICYGEPVPAVDGNVLRVWMRYLADASCISDAKVKARVEGELRGILPKERPGDFNQAMMELGACVCVPNGAPLCASCPLRERCAAHRSGRETDYPVKSAPKARTIDKKTILVIRDGSRAAVHKRPQKGLLAGLYEFPSLEGYVGEREVQSYLAAQGLKTLRILPLGAAKHIFSHREWHMRGYLVRVDELERRVPEPDSDAAGWVYIEPEETRERYPIPAAFEAYTRALSIKLGRENFEPAENG